MWLFVLLGLALMLVAVWKTWSAYDFSAHARHVPGVFMGYHTTEHLDRFRDSKTSNISYRKARKDSPRFSYHDASGSIQQVTGLERYAKRYHKQALLQQVTTSTQ